jgi:phage host-nuclease inhibitor protein Gam
MPPTRRKAARLEAPQTIEEVTSLLADYADIITGVEELRADADSSIAAIQAERDRMVAPLEERAKDIFRQLRAWWAVAGDEITEGKRKSVKLAGCLIGVRTTTPKLSTGKMKVKAAIEKLLSFGGDFDSLIRVKQSLDKPAILKALVSETDGPRLKEAGFSAAQKDEFFIDRAAAKPAAVEEVREAAE